MAARAAARGLRGERQRRCSWRRSTTASSTRGRRSRGSGSATGWSASSASRSPAPSRGATRPYTIGHLNAYPMRRDPLAWRGGAPRAEGRRVRAVLARPRARRRRALRADEPSARASCRTPATDGAYYTHLAVAGEPYDPAQDLTAEPNRVLAERDPASGLRDLDYDGVELLNGPSLDRYRLTRADWLSLLLQGVVARGLRQQRLAPRGRAAGAAAQLRPARRRRASRTSTRPRSSPPCARGASSRPPGRCSR